MSVFYTYYEIVMEFLHCYFVVVVFATKIVQISLSYIFPSSSLLYKLILCDYRAQDKSAPEDKRGYSRIGISSSIQTNRNYS